jgi:Flp pilus assembly protein TadG
MLNSPPRPAKRFFRSTRGNVAFMAAVTFLPLAMAVGMGVDYTQAARRREQLWAIADAAALSMVTPTAMGQTKTAAAASATVFFNNQAAALGYVGSVTNLYIPTTADTVNQTTGEIMRTAFVQFTANSPNIFATLWGQANTVVSGSSTAKNGIAPNINFYILVDSSPSMEVAASSAGVAELVANTQSQTSDGGPGCAFGCHEANPTSSDNAGNPNNAAAGFQYQEDNYTLSKNLTPSIELRIDEVNTALSQLFAKAPTFASANYVTYQASLFSIDTFLNQYALPATTSTFACPTTNVGLTAYTRTQMSLTYTVGSGYSTGAAGTTSITLPYTPTLMKNTTTTPTINPIEYDYNNSYLNSSCGATNNNDAGTNLDNAIATLYNAMPTPGTGATTSTPQEVLLIITDGLNDYTYNGGRVYYGLDKGPISTSLSPDGAWCTTLKKKGVRIAVLYTTYVPMTGSYSYVNSAGKTVSVKVQSNWYDSYIGKNSGTPNLITTLAPAAAACASTGLYQEVTNDGDITAGLQLLFQAIIATAYIAQ